MVKRKITFKETLIAVIFALITNVIINKYIGYITYIPSGSMIPTIMPKDVVVVSRIFKEVEKGKIYVIKGDPINIIKRCVAVPGDKVEMKDNKLYINDIFQSEVIDTDIEDSSYILPEGSYYFVGDNTENSIDCRYMDYPFIKERSIEGVAILKLYSKVKLFE